MTNLAQIKSDSAQKGSPGSWLWLGFNKLTLGHLSFSRHSQAICSIKTLPGMDTKLTCLEFLGAMYPPLWGLGHLPNSSCWHCSYLYRVSPGIYYSLSPGREMTFSLAWTSIKIIHSWLFFGCFQNTNSFLSSAFLKILSWHMPLKGPRWGYLPVPFTCVPITL